jgi:capsular exopolysaccharide synthesis family protein
VGKIFEAFDKTGLAEEILQGLEDAVVPHSTPTEPAPAPVAAALASAPEFRTLSLNIPAASPVLRFADSSHASEQYRILRTKIVQHPRLPRVIVVASASAGDGKSVTAVNLAGALSLKGTATVLLVDGDLRRPSIWRHLGLEQEQGLAGVLSGAAALESTIVKIQEYGNLYVLPAGKSEYNPTELLDSERFTSTMARLRKMFKYVVVDSPPIASVADYDLLTASSDGVIVVVRPDHTNRQACKKALESMPKDKCLGVVMNRVSDWFLSRSYAYAPYYY